MADATPPRTCPHCHAESLYEAKDTVASAYVGFQMLPGLGSFLYPPQMRVFCSACGLIRCFANSQARRDLSSSERWRKL
jgi:hypothetical protein